MREDRERWEADAGRERVAREAAVASLSARERDFEALTSEVEVLRDQRDAEAESAANLQTVLEEFQAGKFASHSGNKGDQLTSHSQGPRAKGDAGRLARAAAVFIESPCRLSTAGNDSRGACPGLLANPLGLTYAQARLSSMQSDSERSLTLQREVKEKNLLIGKLRHEGALLLQFVVLRRR